MVAKIADFFLNFSELLFFYRYLGEKQCAILGGSTENQGKKEGGRDEGFLHVESENRSTRKKGSTLILRFINNSDFFLKTPGSQRFMVSNQ